MAKDSVLITVAGPDNPGITQSLMQIIDDHNGQIADMGQAVTHGLLSLSILLSSNTSAGEEASVLKDLLFEANKMGLNLTYQYLNMGETISPPGSNHKFILNCVAVEDLTASFMLALSQLLAKNSVNILRINNVSPGNFKSLEITTTLPRDTDLKFLKEQLLNISTEHHVDMAFLKDNVFRRSKRLIVFDMDSTLIQTEVIDEMAEVMGVGDEVRAITEMAMNGELDFDESLKQRVSKIKGITEGQLKAVLDKLPLTQGAEEFINTVKNLGYKVGIISGGFTYFAEALKEKLGLDYAFANELEIKNGAFTGQILGQIVNATQKAMILKVIAQQEKIALEQVVAIGDGANDLPMLSAAGLGIAFHAKDIVKKSAEQHLSHGPMTTILYFLGIPGPGDQD
ncbi:MAG: phosphoserine phosphatase SerB [Halobacteriovoraceae bacterium]|jgi:phosphoserine phosphatase|nr:phosphoserine phosphatase SerB [Halobacteriovoraceae bacterium]MBT5094595.1 phosphoserine phosphatase SerB [Halobacteriovoraceae bacterium]